MGNEGGITKFSLNRRKKLGKYQKRNKEMIITRPYLRKEKGNYCHLQYIELEDDELIVEKVRLFLISRPAIFIKQFPSI